MEREWDLFGLVVVANFVDVKVGCVRTGGGGGTLELGKQKGKKEGKVPERREVEADRLCTIERESSAIRRLHPDHPFHHELHVGAR